MGVGEGTPLVEDPQDELLKESRSGTLYVKGELDMLERESTDYFKVGIVRGERDVRARDKALRTGNPRSITTLFELESPFVQALETRLHNQFAAARVSSGEWFSEKRVASSDVIETAKVLNNELLQFQEELEMLEELSSAPSGKKEGEPLGDVILLWEKYVISSRTSAALSKIRRKMEACLLTLLDRAPDATSHFFKSATSAPRKSFSTEALKKDFPELYAEYRTLERTTITCAIRVPGSGERDDLQQEIPSELQVTTVEEHQNDALWLHQQFLKLWGLLEECKWDQWILSAQIHSHARGHFGIRGILEWNEKKSVSFDKDRFAAEHPQVFEACIVETPGSTSFKVAEWASYSLT